MDITVCSWFCLFLSCLIELPKQEVGIWNPHRAVWTLVAAKIESFLKEIFQIRQETSAGTFCCTIKWHPCSKSQIYVGMMQQTHRGVHQAAHLYVAPTGIDKSLIFSLTMWPITWNIFTNVLRCEVLCTEMHNFKQHNWEDLECLVTGLCGHCAVSQTSSSNAFRPLSKDLTSVIMLLILPFSTGMSFWLAVHEDFKGLIDS